jgi:hypothetical protein
MKQTQQIGHQSQEMDVDSVKEKAQIHQSTPAPAMKVDAKPAITNDKGNVMDKQHDDAGKGYNENKPTDSGANHPAPKPHHPDILAVPFEKNEHSEHHKSLEEQEKHEEEEKFLKRAKQAENVQG